MTREAEIARLQAKLDKRRDRPGLVANVALIEAEVARLEAMDIRYRDDATGRFVTAAFAAAHPDTTSEI